MTYKHSLKPPQRRMHSHSNTCKERKISVWPASLYLWLVSSTHLMSPANLEEEGGLSQREEKEGGEKEGGGLGMVFAEERRKRGRKEEEEK